VSALIAITAADPSISAGSRFRIYNWIKNKGGKTYQRPKDPIQLSCILKETCNLDSSRSILGSLKNIGRARNAKPVVIIQKTPPLAHAEEIIKFRDRINFIFDICDPPINNYICSAKSLQAYKSFQMMCEAASVVTTSSPQLNSSIDITRPVIYIPDSIDFPTEPLVYSRDKNILSLLWFGGCGNKNNRTGIYEMLDCLNDLKDLTQYYPTTLTVCSNLSAEQATYVEKLVIDIGQISFRNSPWSIATLQDELCRASYAWLPKTCTLATFYKSNNRLATAAAHGLRTLTNRTLNDESYDFNPYVINSTRRSHLTNQKILLNKSELDSATIPITWKPASIIDQWSLAINIAAQQ
jgi:hypothetical protein